MILDSSNVVFQDGMVIPTRLKVCSECIPIDWYRFTSGTGGWHETM